MDTTNAPGFEQPQSDEPILPKLEDMAQLTGLFNPENIVLGMMQLDDLDESEIVASEPDQPA